MVDGPQLTFGYLVPTRDAVALGRPQTRPLLALGEQAERTGFDAVWVGDSPLARPRHDALAILAALAALTDRVSLGTAVLLPALRSPLLLAQTIATVDQLAAGRLIVGAGAGFPYPETERQFRALGIPYEGRVARMEQSVGAMRALWAAPGEPVSYAGSQVRLDAVAPAPAPVRAGGPPAWLAGAGEAAERRVGRIAVAERRLRRNVERYYQQPLEVIATIQAMYAGTPGGLREWLEPYLAAGARHVILRIAGEDAARGLQYAAEARAAVIAEHETAAR